MNDDVSQKEIEDIDTQIQKLLEDNKNYEEWYASLTPEEKAIYDMRTKSLHDAACELIYLKTMHTKPQIDI